jgi:hypothetical protein
MVVETLQIAVVPKYAFMALRVLVARYWRDDSSWRGCIYVCGFLRRIVFASTRADVYV